MEKQSKKHSEKSKSSKLKNKMNDKSEKTNNKETDNCSIEDGEIFVNLDSKDATWANNTKTIKK